MFNYMLTETYVCEGHDLGVIAKSRLEIVQVEPTEMGPCASVQTYKEVLSMSHHAHFIVAFESCSQCRYNMIASVTLAKRGKVL